MRVSRATGADHRRGARHRRRDRRPPAWPTGSRSSRADREAGCELPFDVAAGELPRPRRRVRRGRLERGGHRHDRPRPQDDRRAVAAGHRRQSDRRLACDRGLPPRDARARLRADRVDLLAAPRRTGLPGQAAYAASKAGLLGLMRTVAAENVRRGITANAILPGMVATEKVRAMPRGDPGAPASGRSPAGRLAEPAEVAALVAYLASEEAGYVTGQAIGVDGGGSLNTFSLTRSTAAIVDRRADSAAGVSRRSPAGRPRACGATCSRRRTIASPKCSSSSPRRIAAASPPPRRAASSGPRRPSRLNSSQIGGVGALPRPQLAGDHRAEVRQHQDLEAPLARHPLADLAEQLGGHRVEQLRAPSGRSCISRPPQPAAQAGPIRARRSAARATPARR